MTDELDSFVDRFRDIVRLSDIRNSSEYDCPEITEELFVRLALELVATRRSIIHRDFVHRFVRICIQYLYRDLRSLQAIEVIIDNSIAAPDIFGFDGCNSLSALSLVTNQLSPKVISRLRPICSSALEVPILSESANRFLIESQDSRISGN